AKLRDIQRVSEPGERKPVDLKALLEKTDTLTRKRCEERAISASFHCAEELPSVTADDGRLQQVFLNLILNATDAMGEGGELRVVARETADPQGVSIDFVDTGTGIDPDVMPRIFEPFVTTKEDGLGLGLYISQSIVQEYGGRIQAENRPGEGTSFTVWLPS
ncbi:MAG TPA: ATP-binding protein, partial [Anaerolineae bacterium]|nr:ATP-binding protein [Anaerolineae bacterium]